MGSLREVRADLQVLYYTGVNTIDDYSPPLFELYFATLIFLAYLYCYSCGAVRSIY